MSTFATRQLGRSTILATLCFLLAGSAWAQRVVNENGGFEASTVGQTITPNASEIENWQVWALEGTTWTAEVVEDPDDTDNLVLRVEITDVDAATNPWDVQAVHYPNPQLTLVQGHEYEVSFRIRAENPAAATVQLDGGTGMQLWGQSISGDGWTTFEAGPFIAGADDARTIGIHLADASNENGQVFYIDDMELVDLDDETGTKAVVVEAESGSLGSELATATDDLDNTYVTTTTNITDTDGATDFPRADRTASYEVTFEAPGWYDFYARVYVGPGGFDDDSFFAPDSFEVKDPDMADGWALVNGLASAGYSGDEDYVSGTGGEGTELWKWVNLSESPGDIAAVDSFYVAPGELTVAFQLGAREDGLWIDKIAFGRSDLLFSVSALDNGEAGVTEVVGPPVVLPEQPLAAGLDKFVGNIYSGNQLENFEYYWNYVIAENAGKWGSVESTRDEFTWAGLDASYALAQENGLPYNFHVLTWGAQQPNWISDLEPDEQREEIREWMEAVHERYPDMDVVQVSNEVLNTHNPPDGQNGRADYKEAFGGDGATGYDWVVEIFRMARDVFGDDARLMLNDYGILNSVSGAERYLYVIELLQAEDLIDVIGVQAHAFSTRQGQSQITAVLDLLATTGLPIQATELDIDGNPNNSAFVSEAQSDANQLADMRRIFPLIYEHPAVEGVTFWGWRPGLWRQDQEAYLVRANGQPRPALVWLQEYLANYVPPPPVATEDGPEGVAELVGNWPNPYTGTTQIEYVLSATADVSLTVYDVTGRAVATLVSDRQPAGGYQVPFSAGSLAGGVYLYRLQVDGEVQTGRMVVAR